VKVSNFGAKVPVQLIATPDNGGGRTVYAEPLDNAGGGDTEHTFPVEIPTNVRVTFHAFAGASLPTAP
jgi:hypothetical protein